jgi:primosomal protein N' (replication factor Y)
MVVEIAVCLPLLRTFHYESESDISPGCRVLVPFRNRDVDGFVVGIHRKAPEGLKILPVKEILDRDSLLAPDVIELCKWISEYYMAPIGEVLKSALPPGITQKHVDRFGGIPGRSFKPLRHSR